jgi:hypothetical protein
VIAKRFHQAVFSRLIVTRDDGHDHFLAYARKKSGWTGSGVYELKGR